MKFPIDVVFVSHDDIVLYIIESMESFRVSPMIRGAVKVIELPAASVKKSGTKVGDQLKFMV